MLSSCVKPTQKSPQRNTPADVYKRQAADRGVEFFKGTDWQPEVAVGDFDSLSAEGALYLQGLRETEIMRLKPEKDDSEMCIRDRCAAPGGKSLHIGDKMEGFGTVDARDISQYKVCLLYTSSSGG